MTACEKWNKIVALHKQYYRSSETTVQNVWESVFVEILGYSRLEGEVERHRNIQLGSTERVIPDIIVKKQEYDLFVVELKQHNIPFHVSMEVQLFSYLKQLRNDVGILVCDKLYVYSFDYSKRDEEQLKWQITFTENNPQGIEFVDKFSKGAFNARKIKALVLEKNLFDLHVAKIVDKITPTTVTNALTEFFKADYSEDEINEAFKRIAISVNKICRPIVYNSTPTPTFCERSARGETFSFEKCHIPRGAVLSYVKNSAITCTVYDDRKVEYQGKAMYMTALVKMLTGSDSNIAGPIFFTYNGKNLQDYYKEYQSASSPTQRVLNTDTPIVLPQQANSMSKLEAIRLFNQVGVSVPRQCTFASLNKNGQYYWANPNINVLQTDWWFILNDTKKRVLYSFMVPGNTYNAIQFHQRNDKAVIDFNVIYSDIAFVDRRSRIDFKQWLQRALNY